MLPYNFLQPGHYSMEKSLLCWIFNLLQITSSLDHCFEILGMTWTKNIYISIIIYSGSDLFCSCSLETLQIFSCFCTNTSCYSMQLQMFM